MAHAAAQRARQRARQEPKTCSPSSKQHADDLHSGDVKYTRAFVDVSTRRPVHLSLASILALEIANPCGRLGARAPAPPRDKDGPGDAILLPAMRFAGSV